MNHTTCHADHEVKKQIANEFFDEIVEAIQSMPLDLRLPGDTLRKMRLVLERMSSLAYSASKDRSHADPTSTALLRAIDFMQYEFPGMERLRAEEEAISQELAKASN